MNRLLLYAIAIICALTACHPIPEEADDPQGNFNALWRAVDEHYCFFSEKDVDWDEVRARYAPLVTPSMSRTQLFTVCSQMLSELRDGHTNLSAPFATSYYREWWSDYPQNFDARLVEQYYFNFNYRQLGSWYYGILPSNVGYLRVPDFTTGLGSGNIDWILSYLSGCSGLIIDLRDNGGGSVSYAVTLARHFITEPTVGYMVHKTGPGHDDFSEPYEVRYEPVGGGHLHWGKPVVLLTNRSTFSAGNFFVAVMMSQPGVRVAGATTGGGSGMPYSTELPCGWGVRMSAVSLLDSRKHVTEHGIAPTPGCEVDLDPAEALIGRDTMIDFAVTLLTE